MEDLMSLEGPVLRIDGQLVLMIPLTEGADELIECSSGISEVQEDFLRIVIPGWLAGILRIEAGDLVCINNADGKLHIRPSNPRPVH
jgi:hypothetical protein